MKMSPLSKHRSLLLDTMRKAHYNFSPSVNLSPRQYKYRPTTSHSRLPPL